jgi:hypothetical protein
MRHTILTFLLMITIAVVSYAAGKHAATLTEPRVGNAFHTEGPHVVLAKSGSRQQNDARSQNEGCAVIPNGDGGRQKANDRESSVMKGLVF